MIAIDLKKKENNIIRILTYKYILYKHIFNENCT